MPIRPIDPTKLAQRLASSTNQATAAPSVIPPHSVQASEPSDQPPIRAGARVGARAPAIAKEASASQGDDEPSKRVRYKVDKTGPNWQDGDYLVGKYRPPKQHQWAKGQSGNPRGPKKREKLDPQAAFDKEVLGDFTVTRNGSDTTLNLGKFSIDLLKAQAAKGSVRSTQLVLELYLSAIKRAFVHEGTPEISAQEQEMLDRFLEDYGVPAKPVMRKTDRSTSDQPEDGEGVEP